jgi:hypothetical protein
MSQKDPWGSAATCAKAALAARDPYKRAMLTYLGEFWLDLAHQDTSKFSESTAAGVAMIERMQAELLGEAVVSH